MSTGVLLLHDAKAPMGSESRDLKHMRARRSSSASASRRVVERSVEEASAECLDIATRRHVRTKEAWSGRGAMLLLANSAGKDGGFAMANYGENDPLHTSDNCSCESNL